MGSRATSRRRESGRWRFARPTSCAGGQRRWRRSFRTTTRTRMRERTETHDAGSVEETQAVAARLAGTLHAGDVIYLEGELGTGKTHFVKGLAAGLGIHPDDVRSPTFTFVDVHAPAAAGRLGLVHVDLYRIADVADLAELGLEDLPGE